MTRSEKNLDLSSVFLIQISDDKMQALIEFNREVLQHRSTQELHELKEQIHLKDLFDFARSKNVTYGLLEDVLLTMIKNFRINQDPVVFARGLAPQHGKNGMLKYHVQLGTTIEINDQEHIDFKIMVIPKVETGTKLVTIIPPTESKDGMNVTGNVVKAKPETSSYEGWKKYRISGRAPGNICYRKRPSQFDFKTNTSTSCL